VSLPILQIFLPNIIPHKILPFNENFSIIKKAESRQPYKNKAEAFQAENPNQGIFLAASKK
jgi:hypothetical protein